MTELHLQLKDQVSEAARHAGRPIPDVLQVSMRARILRRRRRLKVGLGAIVFSSLIVMVAFTKPFDVRGTNGVAGGAATSVSDYRVATFAIRAASSVGLLERNDLFADYESTVASEESWIVTFSASDCSEKERATDNCAQLSEGFKVTVELQGDRLRIANAEGPIDESRQAQLREYSESPSAEPPRFHMPAAEIGSGEESDVVFGTYYWSGPIPSPGYVGFCRAAILDVDGKEIYQTDEFELDAPAVEPMRSGGIHLIELPQSVSGKRATVECETSHLDGWKPAGVPSIERHEGEFCIGACFDGDRYVVVVGTLSWEGRPSNSLFSECQVTVLDGEGVTVGTNTQTVVPPRGEEREQEFQAVVETTDSAKAESAEISCSTVAQ